MKKDSGAGKGSSRRKGENRKAFDDGFDQINWASKRRRGGRSGVVHKDKTKYDRKKMRQNKSWSPQYDEGEE